MAAARAPVASAAPLWRCFPPGQVRRLQTATVHACASNPSVLSISRRSFSCRLCSRGLLYSLHWNWYAYCPSQKPNFRRVSILRSNSTASIRSLEKTRLLQIQAVPHDTARQHTSRLTPASSSPSSILIQHTCARSSTLSCLYHGLAVAAQTRSRFSPCPLCQPLPDTNNAMMNTLARNNHHIARVTQEAHPPMLVLV